MTMFAAVVPSISSFLPGCPSLVIESTIRKIATDLCQRGRVWEDNVALITTSATLYSYALVPTQAYAEVIEPTTLYLLRADGTKGDITRLTRQKMYQQHRSWPQDDDGEPVHYEPGSTPDIALLAPVPDAAYPIYARAQLRPTDTAAEWPTYLQREHHRCVFHGVIHELMAMPERPWSNPKLADYHGKQWTYLLSQATIRAQQEYSTDELAVSMRPFA